MTLQPPMPLQPGRAGKAAKRFAANVGEGVMRSAGHGSTEG